MKKIFLVLVTICSACGPVYDTSYSFTPPKSDSGRSCIYNCETIKRQCNDLERLRQRDCERQADYDERACESNIRWSEGRDPKWYECGRESCSIDQERCDGDYRFCYENCGGKIKAETKCVANCEQVGKNSVSSK